MVKGKLGYDVEIIHVSWKIFCGSETVLVSVHQRAARAVKICQNTKNVEKLLKMLISIDTIRLGQLGCLVVNAEQISVSR